MTEIGPFRFSPHRAQRLQALLRAEGIERAGRVTPRPDPAAPVPLTFSQSRLWFLNRFTAHQATCSGPIGVIGESEWIASGTPCRSADPHASSRMARSGPMVSS